MEKTNRFIGVIWGMALLVLSASLILWIVSLNRSEAVTRELNDLREQVNALPPDPWQVIILNNQARSIENSRRLRQQEESNEPEVPTGGSTQN